MNEGVQEDRENLRVLVEEEAIEQVGHPPHLLRTENNNMERRSIIGTGWSKDG